MYDHYDEHKPRWSDRGFGDELDFANVGGLDASYDYTVSAVMHQYMLWYAELRFSAPFDMGPGERVRVRKRMDAYVEPYLDERGPHGPLSLGRG